MSGKLMMFAELFVFNGLILLWAVWEYFSVSRVQKKARLEAEAAARANAASPLSPPS